MLGPSKALPDLDRINGPPVHTLVNKSTRCHPAVTRAAGADTLCMSRAVSRNVEGFIPMFRLA